MKGNNSIIFCTESIDEALSKYASQYIFNGRDLNCSNLIEEEDGTFSFDASNKNSNYRITVESKDVESALSSYLNNSVRETSFIDAWDYDGENIRVDFHHFEK